MALSKPHIIVLSGAGISAESGLKTFRDAGGLWENHSIEEMATPEAFAANPERVLNFYNERRRQLASARPNAAHRALADLESDYRVSIVTQNVDDLHERAGSNSVLHLHGELTKARSSIDPELRYDIGYKPIEPGQACELGSQLRPDIVWFGEMVPLIDEAMALMPRADYLLIVGTSLQVHPAAGLAQLVQPGTPITVVDPGEPADVPGARVIQKPASEGVAQWLTGL